MLVGVDAERNGIGLRFRAPRLDRPTRRFLAALGPAILGAGGVQLALFADTIIASYLPTGALSALYYADRINQLPIGVVGIAVGTVLLPEMSRRLAAGDERGAASAQARGIQLALLLTRLIQPQRERHAMRAVGMDDATGRRACASTGFINAAVQDDGLAGPVTVDLLALSVQTGQAGRIQETQAGVGGGDEKAAALCGV